MKKYILAFSALFIFFQSASFGQHGDEPGDPPVFTEKQKERIQAKKTAYITNKLEMNPEEAAAFWPLYNEHEKRREDAKHSFHENEMVKNLRDANVLDYSDVKANAVLDLYQNHLNQMEEIDKEFYLGLRKILPPQKVLKYYEVEREFKRFLLQELRGKRPRDGRGPGRR